MKKINGLLIIIIAGISISSCKKYLDEKSNKSLVVPTTLNDLQALLDDSYYMNLGMTPSMPESSSDDYFLTMDNYNTNNETAKKVYNWSLKEYYAVNDWSTAYIPVYNSNVCLEGIVTVPRTETNKVVWDNVKGSALFFRSYYYLNLAWEFAKTYDKATAATDLGIVLRTGTNFNTKSIRATVQESYEKIITDTRESIAYLPEQPVNLLRPSKAAAYGLLARTFLSMREYDSCFKYADLYLQSSNTILDYNSLDLTNTVPFPRFENPETIFYTEMNGSNYMHGTFQAFIDTVLFASYGQHDLRKTGFFYENAGYHTFKGSYTKNPYSFFTGIATDEILLDRAECFTRKDMVMQAMNDLNTLLIKRWDAAISYVPETASSKEEALDKILLERRKELLMRGLRWIDIKRLNKEGRDIVPKRIVDNVPYALPVNDSRYALPIPTDIIRVTGIEQN